MKSVKKFKRLITYNLKNKNKNKKKTIKFKRKTYKKSKKGKTKTQIGGDTPMQNIIKHINFFRKEDRTNYGDIEEYLNPIYGVIMCETGYIENNYYLAKQRKDKETSKKEPIVQSGPQAEEKKDPAHSRAEEVEQSKELHHTKVDKLKQEEYDMSITPEMKFILKISAVVPPNVKPNKAIMQYLTPYIYGRYIAILYFYINLTDENIQTFHTSIKKTAADLKRDSLEILSHRVYKKLTEELNEEIGTKIPQARKLDLLKNFLNVVKDKDTKAKDKSGIEEDELKPSKEMFHILLYCVWWISDDIEGIREYYRGVNATFDRINRAMSKDGIKFPIMNIKPEREGEEKKGHGQQSSSSSSSLQEEVSFERIVEEIVYKPFKVINYGRVNSFRNVDSGPIYSDCVETTMRNFINLILFDGAKFNLEILSKNKVNENTIKYYETFTSFDSQMSNDTQLIYGKRLNAKDAWSYLIIHHAKENIDFRNGTYEVTSGCMNHDNSKTNFIQLLQNLLSPVMITPENIKEKLPELNPFIKSVEDPNDAFKKGLGVINIDYLSSEYIVTFTFVKGHSYAEIKHSEAKVKKIKDKCERTYKGNNYIIYLFGPDSRSRFKNVNKENYLRFKYTSDDLVYGYNIDRRKDNKFLELLSSELGNPDARGRVKIRAYNAMELKDKLRFINDKSVNDFLYVSDKFDFVYEIPHLTSLNHTFHDTAYDHVEGYTEKIDLTPLRQLTSIGNCFLEDYEVLSKIDLSPLTNVTSIGHSFMSGCSSLESINLSPLTNLKTIGHDFMSSCNELTSIDLSPLINVTSIENGFLKNCSKLNSIDLSPLSNVTSIGHFFMKECMELETIKLSPLTNVTTIGHFFMEKCPKLKAIDLSNLKNVISIGDGFMKECKVLNIIDLSPLEKVTSIGINFMESCDGLDTIVSSPLENVTLIKDGFLKECRGLKTIDLSFLKNVTSIGNDFMKECRSLKTIDLSPFTNVTSLGERFLDDCRSLETIDLSPLKNITSIRNFFMNDCRSLKTIDLSPLKNLTSIEKAVMNDCNNLQTIKIDDLPELKKIGLGFGGYCDGLQTIELYKLPKLVEIDDGFVSSKNIKTIILSIPERVNIDEITKRHPGKIVFIK